MSAAVDVKADAMTASKSASVQGAVPAPPAAAKPTTVTDSTDYPEVHRQAREALAATPNSTLRNFTSADRTEGNRELDNFSLKHRVMFDWLDDVMALPAAAGAAPPSKVA